MDSRHTFWSERFRQQTRWTRDTRRYILKQARFSADDSILEVGCGSGAVLDALVNDGFRNLYGIDLDLGILNSTHSIHRISCADGLRLPFTNGTFDHCLCHFYLMWTSDAQQAVLEMVRTTKHGGYVIVLAEPDYGGRIDFPPPLDELGKLQTQSLLKQGAEPLTGRRLQALLREVGLENVQGGIISAEWEASAPSNWIKNDLEVIKYDLEQIMDETKVEEWLCQAEKAAMHGNTTWYVPIFYAYGRVGTE